MTIQKQAVKILHPRGEQRNLLHFLLGNIAGQTLAAGVSQKNVKIASVIPDKEYRFIRHILKADHCSLYASDPQDTTKSPLDNPQGRKIPRFPVFLSDQPFHEEDRNGKNQEDHQKNGDTDKANHRISSFPKKFNRQHVEKRHINKVLSLYYKNAGKEIRFCHFFQELCVR